MNQNYTNPITLKEVAQKINISESAFSRNFKLKTGVTFIESLIHIRLGNADRLLINTNLSISEIAYQCGFNNISNFNRIFRKIKGVTPKNFRGNFSYNKRALL